jgi:hypothetical protein
MRRGQPEACAWIDAQAIPLLAAIKGLHIDFGQALTWLIEVAAGQAEVDAILGRLRHRAVGLRRCEAIGRG